MSVAATVCKKGTTIRIERQGRLVASGTVQATNRDNSYLILVTYRNSNKIIRALTLLGDEIITPHDPSTPL